MDDMVEASEEAVDYQQEAPVPQKGGFFSLGTIVLLAGIAAVAVVFAVALMRQNEAQPTHGPAPDFELTTFEGESFKLSDLQGDVVVLNFWAGWCGPCRDEAPALQNTWEHYRDRGVVFVGVAWADNGPSSRAFLEEFGITYLNGPDLETRISENYNIQGVPETFIINQDGEIAEFIYAGITEASLSAKLDQLLQES
jgi:cytochrome c biogenesis protein CcmG/thiol:disulfide interchange protein DsbE